MMQTYDAKLFPALVSTFEELLELQPTAVIIISAPVRDEKTIEEFLGRCSMCEFRVLLCFAEMFFSGVTNFKIDNIEFQRTPSSTTFGPFYSDAVPMRIMKITK